MPMPMQMQISFAACRCKVSPDGWPTIAPHGVPGRRVPFYLHLYHRENPLLWPLAQRASE